MTSHSYGCPQCNETFETKNIQEKHINEAHRLSNEEEGQAEAESGSECSMCDFKATSKLQMEKHRKVRHGRHQHKSTSTTECMTCDMCDFCGKTESQMKKHFIVRHQHNNEGYYGGSRNGYIKAGFQNQFTPACQNREFCLFWPWCKFSHPEICKFQAECSNYNCTYVHISPEILAFLGQSRAKNQQNYRQTPVWGRR